MAAPALLSWIGIVAAAAAIALLRLAWGASERRPALTGGAWALLVIACVLGVLGDGEWGLCLVSLAAMAMAGVLLAHAGITAPMGKEPAPNRRANVLPPGAPLRLGRRLLAFLFVGPLALIASLLVALGLRALAANAGWAEADSNVLALLMLPLVWGIYGVILLIEPRQLHRLAMLVLPGLAGAALIWEGTAA